MVLKSHIQLKVVRLTCHCLTQNKHLWYSPVVEKANSGEYGFAVNYRKLNKVIKPKAFSLQCFSDLLHSISESHAQYFTSFDLGIAFWHVPHTLETGKTFCLVRRLSKSFRHFEICSYNCPSACLSRNGYIIDAMRQGRGSVIEYNGRALHVAEMNYSMSKLECLAIVEAGPPKHNKDDTDRIEMQKRCPDFKYIYEYLADNVVPEDEKIRKVVQIENKYYHILSFASFVPKQSKGKAYK
ncbi:hypothetical protein MAR_034262 [Mya arenaria]|uniref:Uncharacterized protein n=1 Tax=Mya arenaria TaxID=6604 RepID=A0ABY7GBC7_MYAAR|nr:hypothetical protein MAR_034262 [Mya arenaria]